MDCKDRLIADNNNSTKTKFHMKHIDTFSRVAMLTVLFFGFFEAGAQTKQKRVNKEKQ